MVTDSATNLCVGKQYRLRGDPQSQLCSAEAVTCIPWGMGKYGPAAAWGRQAGRAAAEIF